MVHVLVPAQQKSLLGFLPRVLLEGSHPPCTRCWRQPPELAHTTHSMPLDYRVARYACACASTAETTSLGFALQGFAPHHVCCQRAATTDTVHDMPHNVPLFVILLSSNSPRPHASTSRMLPCCWELRSRPDNDDTAAVATTKPAMCSCSTLTLDRT
jgi:hypothetical protein